MTGSSGNLRTRVSALSEKLIQLVKDACINELSANHVFVLRMINGDNNESLIEQRRTRIIENEMSNHLSLAEVSERIAEIIHDVYDLNLFIHKAEKERTVFEVGYVLKSSFDTDYQSQVKEISPMFHAKLRLPPNLSEGQKFDVNWEFEGLFHL